MRLLSHRRPDASSFAAALAGLGGSGVPFSHPLSHPSSRVDGMKKVAVYQRNGSDARTLVSDDWGALRVPALRGIAAERAKSERGKKINKPKNQGNQEIKGG